MKNFSFLAMMGVALTFSSNLMADPHHTTSDPTTAGPCQITAWNLVDEADDKAVEFLSVQGKIAVLSWEVCFNQAKEHALLYRNLWDNGASEYTSAQRHIYYYWQFTGDLDVTDQWGYVNRNSKLPATENQIMKLDGTIIDDM